MAELKGFTWPKILYDPTEKPRGIITADEWNRIFSLILGSIRDVVEFLADNWDDLATWTILAQNWQSHPNGPWGTDFIGAPPIDNLQGTNLTELLNNFYTVLQNVVLGQIPDGTITGDKLADPFDYPGDSFSWKGNKILTVADIDTMWPAFEELSDDKMPSTKLAKNTLDTKQQMIECGVTPPTQDTTGNIYIQYFVGDF